MIRSKTVFAVALAGFGFAGLVPDAMAAPAPAPISRITGMRRLSETEYRNSIADIFGRDIEIQGIFEPDRRVGGLVATSSAILSITPAGFEAYTKMADRIAAQVVDIKHRARTVACTPKNAKAADDACAKQALTDYGKELFRRPLTPDELNSRVNLAKTIATSTGDFYTGLRYSLASLIAAPEFLFRTEVAVPVAGAKDKDPWTLDAYSRASRLSYLLWDSTPDAALLAAADAGALATPDGVAKQVDRMMASPRLVTGVKAFYTDFLELDTSVVKDASFYPKFSDAVANSAKEETLRSMIDLTITKQADLRDLLTTRKTFIDRVLASVYGVPYNFDSEWVPYEFSADSQRSGILTQVTFLSLFSHPNRSSPTKRGVALLDIFMCEPTPAPPANVSFDIINDLQNPKLKTVRQRLLAHATNPICASCHNHSDPIGLALEDFDSIGEFRTTENGDVIDVSSSLQGKAFAGAVGLGQALHDNPKFPACFAGKMYSYGTGANSQDVSAKTTVDALNTFIKAGYKVPVLIRAIATSPQYFAAPPPPAPPANAKTAMNTIK